MIPKIDSFALRSVVRDDYGKITETNENIFWGVIERQTQFRTSGGNASMVGEGMIFCSGLQGIAKLGQEVIVDDLVFTITQVFDASDLSGYHHTEIVYG